MGDSEEDAVRAVGSRWQDVAALAQLVIAGVWLWAAISKGLDFDGFVRAVEGHGIIPRAAHPLLAAVPVYEGLLGLALAILGARRTGGLVLGLSAASFALLIAYLTLVPPEAFAKVGCGCAASARPTASESPMAPIVRNTLLLLLHLPAAMALTASARAVRIAPAAPPGAA